MDAEFYRVFHEGKCFELAIQMAYSNEGNYDPGIFSPFTKQDQERVHGLLNQPLNSFRFLK